MLSLFLLIETTSVQNQYILVLQPPWVSLLQNKKFKRIFSFGTQWYKLDELFEQERNVRTAMTNRAGLLALMLHQTIQHDPVTTDLRSNKDR